jgi:hypothetical protein
MSLQQNRTKAQYSIQQIIKQEPKLTEQEGRNTRDI